MSNGPRIVVGDDRFRLVRVSEGAKVTYVLEVTDGADALGVERWREVSADGKPVKAMRDFLIRQCVKQEQSDAHEG